MLTSQNTCPDWAVLCVLTQRPESPLPSPAPKAKALCLEKSYLCPSYLDGEDVHDAGAEQGTDGDMFRHIKGCIINITIVLSLPPPPLTYLHVSDKCWL